VPLIVTVLLALFLSRTGPRAAICWPSRGNSHAAELSGISVPSAIMTAHFDLRPDSRGRGRSGRRSIGVRSTSIGSDWLLISFAAPIIGGASLLGGSVSIAGTLIAVLLIGLIQNGMVLLAVDPYWVTFLLGGS